MSKSDTLLRWRLRAAVTAQPVGLVRPKPPKPRKPRAKRPKAAPPGPVLPALYASPSGALWYGVGGVLLYPLPGMVPTLGEWRVIATGDNVQQAVRAVLSKKLAGLDLDAAIKEYEERKLPKWPLA